MANDNQAAHTGALFLGSGLAAFAVGRWIIDRRPEDKRATGAATPAPAAPRPVVLVTSPAPAGRDDASSGGPGQYPPAVERWRALVTELGGGINVDFLLTWILHESGGNPCATGIPNKETGLFQSYHPHDDRHGATFAELRAACLPGKQTAHRPLTAAEQRLQVSAGIALVRACMKAAMSTLTAIGAQWSSRDRYCLAKLVHGLPAYASSFPRAYVAQHGRPPASWPELRAWVRSLSEAEVIAIDRGVRPWASVAQRDRLFGHAERVGRAADRRNASWFAIKTPGVILDEMNAARNEVESLGRDIYATYRHTFDAQITAAEERFFKTYGRKPGVGRAAQKTDYEIVHSWMQPVPTADDLRHMSYQGQFVYQWGEFEREFGNFWAAHAHSVFARMWRGTYDKAVEYRQRAAEWRKRFEAIGGKPTTPAPMPPTEHVLPPGFKFPWKEITVIGGIAAAALIIPAAIRASKRD